MSGLRMAPRVELPKGMIRRLSAACLLLIASSCVPSASAYRAIPGLRGQEVTVAVEPLPEGVIAPRLMTTPLTPIQVDISSLPALDAVTNPAIAMPTDLGPPPIDPATGTPMPVAPTAPPLPLPNYRALAFNAGPAVAAFAFRGQTMTDSMRSQQCLTAAIYYEAASESEDGQRAVAQVVLNRVRHPAYPNTVCDVVYQGTERGDRLCQFSFACDGSMARLPNRAIWAQASRIARLSLLGYVFAPVGAATHYHTLAVNPYWNKSLTPVTIIGAHIFYRWGGAAGQPGAFYARYAGREPFPGPRAHPIRPIAPMATPYPQFGIPGVIATGPVPPPSAPLASDGSLAAIQARASQSVLAQQAALARATQPMAAPARPVSDDNRYVSGSLPESDVRPEFQGSGDWIKKPK